MTADLDIDAYAMRTAPDEVLGTLHGLQNEFELEARPDEVPTPYETYASRHRTMPSHYEGIGWVARHDGEVVGAVTADLDRTGDNAHIIEAFVQVRPSHRGRGIGRRLLAPVIETADRESRRLLFGYTNGFVPSGGAFMQRLGAVPGLVERGSELDLKSLDRDLVLRWVEDGPVRAPDYELLLIEDHLPDELLEPFAALYDVSNSAPREALEMEDAHRTPEQIRDIERSRREGGFERILYLARHRPTGALAGWTELARHGSEPWKVQQYWTAVHPDHRGHALGKWLKAANIQRALERWPEARKIETGNALSNDAMLGINNGLGFRETESWTVWQVPVEEVRAYVHREPAAAGS